MDLIVTEAPTNDIINEALETDLFGDQYPGRNIRDISLNEKNAIEEALKIKNYISPLSSILEEISDIISDNESSTSTIEDLPHKFQDTKQTKIVETEKIISSFVTPNMFSNIPRDQVIDEMNEELFDLRKKVSMSINMKSFINKLGKNEDIDYEIRFISEYAKKKFQIYISPDDFLSLTRDEILELYNKTKDASKVDKFSLLYRFVFDIGISQFEKLLNTYVFEITNLKQMILYDDIAIEIEEIFREVQTKTIGKYVDHSSPIIRILIYIVSQILKSKI